MTEKAKFKPTDEVLVPIVQRYEEFAMIDGAIVDEAAKRFKEYPPDDELQNILKAEDGD